MLESLGAIWISAILSHNNSAIIPYGTLEEAPRIGSKSMWATGAQEITCISTLHLLVTGKTRSGSET